MDDMELALHYHGVITQEISRDSRGFLKTLKAKWPKSVLSNQGIMSRNGKVYLEILLDLVSTAPGRIYFGNEFCEKRIPATKELKVVSRFCKEEGLSLTLLTPGMTNMGILKARRLLDLLTNSGLPCEVVVNDFGMLNIVNRDYPGIPPVLGRLLSNMKTMPRFAGRWPGEDGTDNPGHYPASVLDLNPHQIYALQSSSISVGIYRSFLKSKGVKRIELNPLPQGMNLPEKRSSLRVSLHFPWVYITSSRMCEMGSMHLQKNRKFIPGGGCAMECKEYISHWDTAWPTASEGLLNTGNTVFMVCDMTADALNNYIHANRIDRVVFSLLPPF